MHTHTTTIKKVKFYITNLVDTKVILGLQFCRAFNLVSVNCNDNCVCKEVAVEALNTEFPRGLDPAGSIMQNRLPPPPPVNMNTKLEGQIANNTFLNFFLNYLMGLVL